MLKYSILLFSILLIPSADAQNKGDNIFDSTILHELRISSEDSPNLYDSILNNALTIPWDEVRPYYMVKLAIDDKTIDSVGVRAKGNLSATDTSQAPMKIDINEYVDDQTFDGVKKLNLGNNYDDEFLQRDRVSYELFKRAGIASPRSVYTEVYVNDSFVNVYSLTEQIDKTFIEENFPDKGSLFKVYELIYGEHVFLDPDLTMDFTNRLERVNPRQYFKFLLMNNIADAYDNYPNQNFYIYYSAKENLYHFLPWDYNLSFSGRSDNVLYPQEDSTQIWDDPSMKAIYLDVACEFYNYLLDEDYLEDLIDSNHAIISENNQNVIAKEGEFLIDFLRERRDTLLSQMQQEDYTCLDFFYPYLEGDLVINEFVAKSDSIGGVQEPDGGTPDWIELYNNSDESITLNHHFYLTNDIDFPKKWNFKNPVTIPSKGYQIVWADRDVQQQDVHASFKIEKSGGDLMMVYEDMTVIDHVKYDKQELNKGYARVPNGTGNFVIQNHTFNGNNDEITSVSTLDKNQTILVYPNPTSESIYVVTTSAIEYLQVYASNGQKMMEQIGNNYFVDLGGIPSGIYFIEVQTGNQNKVVKLIKQ